MRGMPPFVAMSEMRVPRVAATAAGADALERYVADEGVTACITKACQRDAVTLNA